MPVREQLEEKLSEIRGVVRRPSRRGRGHAYFAGDREIAHFHGDLRLDVRLTRENIRQRVSKGAFDERVRTRGPTADWVAVRVAGVQDLPLALALVAEAVLANARPCNAAESKGSN